MTDTPDERAEIETSDLEPDPAEDAREEYTSYRDREPETRPEEEAAGEAELQPGQTEEAGEQEKPESGG